MDSMNKIKQIMSYGIFANTLKVFAIVAMVIDHIAYYFEKIISPDIYNLFRAIGRIAMPLFVFLLVQGFFNTKNFKKYVTRISVFAVITQVLITILHFVEIKYFPGYTINIYTFGNILFSFAITLGILKIIHLPTISSKYSKEQNWIIKLIIVFGVLMLYVLIPIDYGITVPILAIMFYAVERFRITLLISKDSYSISFKGWVLQNIDHETVDKIYKGLLSLVILMAIVFLDMRFTSIFSLLLILLYNGERKVQRKYVKMWYYVFFPLHHVVLYLVAMIVMTKVV